MNARPRRPGRPAKLDEAKRREVCAILAAGGSWTTAAQYVGCSLSTIRRTARRDPQFAADLQKAGSQCEVSYLRQILTAAREHKQWRAAAWALERIDPDRYRPRKPGTASLEQVALMAGELVEYMLQQAPASIDRASVLRRFAQLVRRLRGRRRAPRPNPPPQEPAP